MTVDTAVIGAGPAGLATSRELKRRGVPHVVLERGDRIGHTWAHLYDSLVLHTGKHLSALPGLRFPASTSLFPTRLDFLDYLDRYAATFQLPVQTRVDVIRVERQSDWWHLWTAEGEAVRARAIVVATGTVSNPTVPLTPDRNVFAGRVRHSVEYKNAAGLTGRRVLVVGVGNSAGEIAAELSRAGARVVLAVRSGATVVPRQVLGIPIQYLTIPLGYLPWGLQRSLATLVGRAAAVVRGKSVLPPHRAGSCARVPLIGFHLTDEVRRGAIQIKGAIACFLPGGVRFADGTSQPFDEVILATGYRAAVGMFNGAVRVDACGFAQRTNRVASADLPNLYFVGHNPDVRGGLFTIGRDARLAAKLVRSCTS